MVLEAQREPRGPPLLGIIRNIPGNKFPGLGTRSAASRDVQRPKPVKSVAIFFAKSQSQTDSRFGQSPSTLTPTVGSGSSPIEIL